MTVPGFAAAKWLCDRHTATLEQQTLVEFISSGMNATCAASGGGMRARRKTLLKSITKSLGDRVEMSGDGPGAHVLLWFKRPLSEEAVIAAADAQRIGVYGVSTHFLTSAKRCGILLGYARMKETEIREKISRLSEVI